MIKNTLIFLIIITVSGCSTIKHTYKPRPETFKMDKFPDFNSPVAISILNSQPDDTNNVHLDRGIATFSGSKKSWTDTAIEIVKRELIKRQARIENGADKILKLSITSIDASESFWGIRYITKLKVITGSNYVNSYTGDNKSPATVFRAADGAVMRAVSAMFRDPKIISYISSEKK
jgi:hypothetical protein